MEEGEGGWFGRGEGVFWEVELWDWGAEEEVVCLVLTLGFGRLLVVLVGVGFVHQGVLRCL